MFLTSALRLVGFTLGASLHVFLVVLLVRKHGAKWFDRLVLAAVASAGLWHLGNSIAEFHRATAGTISEGLMQALGGLATAGRMLAPPLWVGATLALVYTAQRDPEYRRAAWALAGAVMIAAGGILSGPDSAAVVYGSLAPPLCLAYFIYRYNFLGLLISRRLVFALTLGVVFAFYLVAVRRLAGFVEDEFEALGPLVEVALLFAAALVWLPLYGWMTRSYLQRTQLYADFSKRLIEEAARILHLGERLEFLAREFGRTFKLHRVLLLTIPEGLRREFGPARAEEAAALRQLARSEALLGAEMFHVERTRNAEIRQLLSRLRFHYLFPLRYEDRLIGLLLLDTTPRRFLDENEPILLGLTRQICHSIETCRLIEGKIGLERALVRQEHLASLGKVAATMAHEIKNPLSSIKTLAQLMREDQQVEQHYARDLAYMIAEADRLNRSVVQLLTFSRPAPERETEVNVSEILETTAGVLAREHAAAGIQIEAHVQPGLRLPRANPELLQQIVLNLILNAIQASPQAGFVHVSAARQEDGKIQISISDQGPGVSPEVREKIFEPFYTTKQRGTGLGLAIVRKDVRHLEGEIQVESPLQDGRGTRILVTLPAT